MYSRAYPFNIKVFNEIKRCMGACSIQIPLSPCQYKSRGIVSFLLSQHPLHGCPLSYAIHDHYGYLFIMISLPKHRLLMRTIYEFRSKKMILRRTEHSYIYVNLFFTCGIIISVLCTFLSCFMKSVSITSAPHMD